MGLAPRIGGVTADQSTASCRVMRVVFPRHSRSSMQRVSFKSCFHNNRSWELLQVNTDKYNIFCTIVATVSLCHFVRNCVITKAMSDSPQRILKINTRREKYNQKTLSFQTGMSSFSRLIFMEIIIKKINVRMSFLISVPY